MDFRPGQASFLVFTRNWTWMHRQNKAEVKSAAEKLHVYLLSLDGIKMYCHNDPQWHTHINFPANDENAKKLTAIGLEQYNLLNERVIASKSDYMQPMWRKTIIAYSKKHFEVLTIVKILYKPRRFPPSCLYLGPIDSPKGYAKLFFLL